MANEGKVQLYLGTVPVTCGPRCQQLLNIGAVLVISFFTLIEFCTRDFTTSTERRDSESGYRRKTIVPIAPTGSVESGTDKAADSSR